ncbi:hypothetical protein [Methylocystis bryophila]|uniref:Uncharacterized protein n=1 Tax=Methylocystis bryophila TaxID=655015 RepID=A0A1W6MY93_9HYPH|nr:hypothetical protein [Methylocystis bryophila]ARN82545.1 hypothetical protein B1812_17255 [Methylocystis bryophila]BDV38748.1 hypothetical protein DSM21852_20010 [Methylocystis bryophila]
MKATTVLAAAAFFVGMTSFAFAECDTHKGDRDTDKQTKCSEKCEDGYMSGTMVYGSSFEEQKAKALACFQACGCEAHGAEFVKEHGTNQAR